MDGHGNVIDIFAVYPYLLQNLPENTESAIYCRKPFEGVRRKCTRKCCLNRRLLFQCKDMACRSRVQYKCWEC